MKHTSAIGFILALLCAGTGHAEVGVSKDSILLGQSIYLTGGLAGLGNDLTTGAKLYFEKVNAQGGINGRKILLETLDDAYDPAKAKTNAEALIESKKVFALFQFAGTGSIEVVAPVAEAKQVPLCAAVATGPELRSKHFKNVFYVRAGNAQEIKVISRHLATIERKRVAVVYLDAPYGLQGRAVAVQAAAENGLVYVGDAAIPGGAGNDAAVEKAALFIASKKPDSVLLITAGKATVAIVRALRQLGLRNDQLYALAAALSPAEIKALDVKAEGLVVSQVIPNPASRSQPLVLEFSAAVAQAGLKPNHALLEGWINAAVCVSALKKAGPNLNRSGFLKALESTDGDFAGAHIRFNKQRHGGSEFVELTFVKNEGTYAK